MGPVCLVGRISAEVMFNSVSWLSLLEEAEMGLQKSENLLFGVIQSST